MKFKKWNLFYLFLIILVFILSMIPYFQNTLQSPILIFFANKSARLSSVYFWILFFGILEGTLITLYLQSLFKDLSQHEVEKFDLDK